jgi:hypothetical protein
MSSSTVIVPHIVPFATLHSPAERQPPHDFHFSPQRFLCSTRQLDSTSVLVALVMEFEGN